MINVELLENKMNDSGMTKVDIAKKSGMLRETLYNKLRGKGEFKASEITGLCRTLNLSSKERDKIFFD